MKRFPAKLLFLSFLAVLLSACGGSFGAQTSETWETFPSQFLVGDTYILKDNQKIDGNIVGIGTTLVIEEGAMVMGDISLVGSNLEIQGRVAGDVNVFAGTSHVRDTAIITGNINQVFQSTDVEPGALISGENNTYEFPTFGGIQPGESVVNLLNWMRPGRILLLKLGQVLALVIITILVIYLLKQPTQKVSEAIRINLPGAWGAGLLTYIAVPILSIVFIITICLSPIGLLALLALFLSVVWGWVALSSLVGKFFMQWLKVELRSEPSAILGAAILGLGTSLVSLIPCIGLVINLLIGSFGLGGVLLSRFGTYKK